MWWRCSDELCCYIWIGRSDDGADPARFFLPSFLQDPWRHLEASQAPNIAEGERRADADTASTRQEAERRPGRVLFQPSFLQDPWAAPFFQRTAVVEPSGA